MEEYSRNLEESIVLENLFVSIMPKMKHNQDREFYKFVRDRVSKNYTQVAMSVREICIVNLVKEIIVLLNQMWRVFPDSYDEGLIKQKVLFNTIKANISNNQTLPFNNKELYKRIREAIAHNDANNPNIVYKFTHFELNLGKVNGMDYIIQIKPKELSELLYILFINRKNTSMQEIAYQDQEIHSAQDIVDCIRIIDLKTGEQKPLDENQIDRAYNYFMHIAENAKISDNLSKSRNFIALPNNPEFLILEKLQALHMFTVFDTGSTFKKLQEEADYLKDSATNVNIYFAIVTNLLFEIVSSQTNQQIAEMFAGTGVNLTEDQVRHLRNSLCHGSYFHDYNKTFYFYDGAKELSLQLKLQIGDINKLLDKVAKGQKQILIMT